MDLALRSDPVAPSKAALHVDGRLAGSMLVWLSLITTAHVWGRWLSASGVKLYLHAPPLFGRIDPLVSPTIIPALVVAAFLIWRLPLLARALSWRSLLVVASASSAAWIVALAGSEGVSGLVGPLLDKHDYLAALPRAAGDPHFLTGFTDRLWTYPIHVQGHPPGMLLFLGALRDVGLNGAAWAAGMIVAIGASAVAAVLITVRSLAREDQARACAPFLVLAPTAVWIGTSADALFMGVAAWAVALAALAVSSDGRAWMPLSLIAGATAGAAMFLSYGVTALGSLIVAWPRRTRTAQATVVIALGVVGVAVLFQLAGFSWVDGLRITVHRYEQGVSSTRPHGFFFFNNLAAFSLALGPAVFYAFTRLRDRRVWLIVGAVAASVILSNISGLSKGEVERIWLPFAPWLLVATCAIPAAARRHWLAAQAIVAVAIQLIVRTPW